MHSRAFRAFRAIVTTFLSLWAVYIVGINAFLWTSLFERVLDGDPATIDIHHRRSWSVVPGRIHGRGLSIRGRDSNVEWILKLDEADFDMSFVAFVRTRFDVSRVHARGISFRLRSRLDAAPTTPLEIAEAVELPTIDGLPSWSVRPPKKPSADVWSDADYHLWTAHIENIVADDIREIWIDREHFEGDARIDGRFYFKPLRNVDVGPAHIAIRRGRVHIGPSPIADDLAGTIDATVAPFDPRTAGRAELVHAVSAKAELRARCPDIGSVPYTLPGGTRTRGPIEVRALSLRVRSGVLQDGTHVDLALPAASIEQGAHHLTGAIVASARVVDGRLDATAECTELAVTRSRRPIVHAPGALVTADGRALDLADPLGDLHLVVDVPRGRVPDARVLSGYIPKATPLAIVEGRVEGTARIEMWLGERRAAGKGTLHADDLALRLAKLRVRGQTTAEMSFATYRFDTGHVEDARLAVGVAKGVLAYERTPAKPLVDVAGLGLDAHAADLVPEDPLRTMEAHVAIHEGSIVEPGLLAEYLPKGSAMRIRGGHGRFALDGKVTIVDHIATGGFALHSKALGLTLHDLTLTAGLRAQVKVHDWRWPHGDLALDRAAVDVTDVVVTRGDRRGLTVRRILVAARSPRFDLTDPLAAVTFTTSIEGAHVSDAAIVNAFLPDGGAIGLDATDGLFAAIATATVRRHVARATIAASADDMGFTDGTIHLLGDTTLEAAVADWDLARSTMAVKGARIVLSDVKGRLQPDGDPREVSARRIEVLAATPLLELANPVRQSLDAHLIVDHAELPDACALRAFIPAGSVLSVESGSAQISADLEIAASDGRAKGAVELLLSRAGIALDKTHLAGDFALTAKISQYDPDAAKLDLSGSVVAMRNVSVTGVSTPTTGWSGDLVFDQASVEFTPRTVIEGGFHLEARDANPLFALLFRDEIPEILVGLTPMDHLSASGRVTADAYGFSLHDLDARGGSLRAHGSYASERDERRGAFVVEKGPYGVGIRIHSGVTLRFFGLRGWLEDERKLVERVRMNTSRTEKTR